MGGTLILSPAQAKTGATPSSETRTLHENGAPANRKQGVQEFSGVPLIHYRISCQLAFGHNLRYYFVHVHYGTRHGHAVTWLQPAGMLGDA